MAHHGKIYLGRYSFSNVGPIDIENMGHSVTLIYMHNLSFNPQP
jgi:hypothetical protein